MSEFRALLVGAGGMGRAWARNLRDCDATDVCGWVDIVRENAIAASTEVGLAGLYTSANLSQAICEVQPDFVVDVTVPDAHHDVTITSLDAGIPVIGEKPMAESMKSAREMVAASERSGKLYMVSQSRRYDARIHAFRGLIESSIGAPGILNVDFYIGAHFGGFRDEMASPLLLDMAIHTFDQARYLSERDAVAVYCEEFNPSWSWYRGDSCASALFEMEDGMRFSYRGAWCSEGRNTSWEGKWRAVGPLGTAEWDGADQIEAAVVGGRDGLLSNTVERRAHVDSSLPLGIAGSLQDFLRALRTGSTPMGECHDNIKSLAMVFAAIESSHTGRKVTLAELP